MKNKFTFLPIIIFLLFNSVFAQSTYYVSNTGSDVTGDGSSLNPWATIQFAINSATAGSTIDVAAGTYPESLTINKWIIISGAGSGSNAASNTVITPTSPGIVFTTGGTSSTNRSVLQNIRVTGVTGGGNTGSGIQLQSSGDHIDFINVASVSNTGHGICVNNGPTDSWNDVTITNCDISGNSGDGFRIPTSMYSMDGLTISNSTINNNQYGIEIYNAVGRGLVTNVSISNTTFNHNLYKGIYAERLDHASFTGLTIDTSGTGASSPAGIDINLKYNNFQHIVLDSITVIGSGVGDATNGIGITVKGRNDGGYAANPATLDSIIIKNSTVEGCPNGIAVGNAVGVADINYNTIQNNTHYGLINFTAPLIQVNAENNWWGVASGPYNATTNASGTGNAVTDNIDYSPWLGNNNDTPHDSTHHWTFYVNDNISAVITLALPNDTIKVLPGTYNEIVLDKPLILIGSQGSIINHGSPAITVSSTGVVINGFTFNFNASDYAIDVLSGAYNVTVINCDFLNTNSPNKGNGVRNQGTGTVTAAYNYWGDPNGPTVGSNSCGSGAIATNSSTGSLIYSPWYVDHSPHTTLLSSPVLTAPLNLATGVTITPSFVWNLSYGASSTFKIEIATDNAFANVVYTANNISSPFQLPDANKLDNGTIYYWRITASDSGGYSCAASKFTTIAPATPVLTYPSNLSTVIGNTVNFIWYAGVAGIQYRVYLSTSSSFTSYVAGFDTSYTTLNYYNFPFNYSTLPAGTYYWRVKSFTQTGVLIGISSTWQFVVPGPPTAIPSYPVGGTTVYSTTPSIYWYLNDYFYQTGVKYKVMYSTTSDTSMPYSYSDSTAPTTNLYATLSGLNVGSTYYYRVKASVDNFATYTWSLEENFVVFYSSPYGVPVYLAYPILGQYVYTSTPTLYWYIGLYIPGVSFDLQIDNTDNTFTHLVKDTSGVIGYYYTSSSLSDGTYYWRVRLTGTSTWYSDTFVVSSLSSGGSSAATIPVPLSPIGGAVVTSQSPSLSWYAYSLSSLDYQVIWSSDPTLSSGVLTYTSSPYGGSSGWLVTNSYTISGLSPGVTYYWQVRSRLSSSPSTVSDYSTVGQFTVSPGASPVVLLPANPISGININSTAANMSWVVPAKSSSPLLYDLEISKNADMQSSQEIKNLSQPTYKATNLDANSTYYWRVRSKNSDGEYSSYSYKGQFSTGSTTGVEEIKLLPTSFNLSQNYPNPFNPTTQIQYSLPKNTFVSLKIYDILGQEVKTLVSGEETSGNYNVEWDGTNKEGAKVTSGVYIYRIVAGSFVSVKKMLLMK